MLRSTSMATLRAIGKAHFQARMRRSLHPAAYEDLTQDLDTEIQTVPATEGSQVEIVDIDGLRLPVFGIPQSVPGEPLVETLGRGGRFPIGAVGDEGVRLGFDLWSTIGFLLTDGTSTLSSPAEPLSQRPAVDLIEQKVFDGLSDRYGRTRSQWPRDAPFALGLSHDVDRVHKTFQYLTHPARALLDGRFRAALSLATQYDPKAYWRFDQIRDVERRHRVASTFFFLHEVPPTKLTGLRERMLLSGNTRLDDPEVAEVISLLHEDGWEIGLHSSTYARRDPSRLLMEKEFLEGVAKSAVPGVRQHFLAPVVSDLWRYQEQAKFEFDSSMGPAGQVGFRSGTCFPYPSTESGMLYEVPFQIMDGSLFGNTDPWSTCLSILDRVAQVGGALVLLWHQRVFNEHDFPGLAEVYERIIVECARRGAWIAPLGKIVTWWKEGRSDA